ncbi:MAG: LysR family transcriptional regulator, partial [Pseudomonadota bacterium]
IIASNIMLEGSITRASERLAMTQPAVSNALSRMRSAWKDELFVKDGRNIQPTLYAKNLWVQIKGPLQALRDAVTPDNFQPATTNRTFRVAAADLVVEMAWRPLRKLIQQQAPLINLYAFPYTLNSTESLLNDAEVDLVVGAGFSTTNSIIKEFLFDSNYVCVMRPEHPLTQTPLSLDSFAQAEHLLVSLSGDTNGFSDEALAQYGLERRVAMTVNHFAAVPQLLKESELIAVVPSTAIEQELFHGKLIAMKPPIEIPSTQIVCFSHRRQEYDAGLSWLRQHLSKFIKQHVARHYQQLDKYNLFSF